MLKKVLTRSLAALVLVGIAQGAGAEVLIQDGFEYEVDRDTDGASAVFAAHGWAGAKTNQDGRNAGGWLYTVTSIPGFSGSFPGADSSRALKMEIFPGEVEPGWFQTDLYLGYGQEGGPRTAVPADSWFQFWLYVNEYGDEMTQIKGGKFIYPSGDGTYPSTTSDWLFTFNTHSSYLPFWAAAEAEGQVFFMNRPPAADFLDDPEYPTNKDKLGGNLVSGMYGVLEPNQWHLVKIHIDISGASPLAPGGQGVYEMWLREPCVSWRKTTEWIGGVTPQFTWPISNAEGHAAFRVPTTVDGWDADRRQAWIYMDDFVFATSESDLPAYEVPAPECDGETVPDDEAGPEGVEVTEDLPDAVPDTTPDAAADIMEADDAVADPGPDAEDEDGDAGCGCEIVG